MAMNQVSKSVYSMRMEYCKCWEKKKAFFFFLNESMWLHQILVTATQDQHFVVQSLSRVRLFVTPWTAACQASLSFAISRSLLKLIPSSQ